MTGTELATAVLELIGVTSPADGGADAGDVETVLRHANRMRKSWNARSLVLHAIERATYTWPTSQATRTIGPSGAQLTGTRPLQVLAAKVLPVGQTTEIPVDLMTHLAYAAIGQKAQTADYFTRLLYEPTGASIGTFTVWPVPTSAPTLIIHARTLLSTITDATDIVVPEAYEAALVSQLAKRVHGIFGKPWTQELEDQAREDIAVMQRANIRIPDEKGMPAGFPGARGGGVSDSQYDSGRF